MAKPLYNSKEAKQLPSGLYLGLFHGRDNPEDDMEDWGFQGPVVGPLKAMHTTYGSTCRIKFVDVVAAKKFFPDFDYRDEWVVLEGTDELLEYEGKYYGDWTVFLHEQEILDA